MKRTLLALVTAVLLAGCSVSTPRHEAGFVRASGETAAGDGVGLEGAAAVDGVGAVDPATGVPTASGGAGGRGAAAKASGSKQAGSQVAGSTAKSASNGGATGVTGDSVTISVIAGFSGPLAPMVTRAYDGLATWQDDVNAAGGIHGRKVVLKKVDHKETADGGVAACKEAQSNGSLFATVPEGIEATLTAVSCLDAAGIPTLYYSATVDPKWKYAFADIATSAHGGTQMASFVRNRLAGGGKKVGMMYVNQASYKAMSDSFVPEARKLGLDVAGVEAVEPNQASFTSPLLRLRNAGVQILVISATTDAVGILRDAKSMGWTPQFTGWGFQFDFVTQGGRNLFDGVAALRSYATVDSPAFEKYLARMKARGRDRDRSSDLEGFSAYGHALVLGEVLNKAGVNPTRQSVISGAESITNFDNGVFGPISWSPTDHVGSHATFPTVCCNSDYTWKGIGPPRTVH